MARYSNLKRTLFTNILMCGLVGTTFAGAPFDTSGPSPTPLHHWELLVTTKYNHDGTSVSGVFPRFEFNYGVVPNLQLHLILPLSYKDQAGKPSKYGYGDTVIGVKYRFVNETKYRPMIGIYPHYYFNTGSVTRGLGSGKPQLFLPLWLQKTNGTWTSIIGGGYQTNPGVGKRHYWKFGYELKDQVTKEWMVGGELYYTTASKLGGTQEFKYHLGCTYSFNKGHQLLFAIGRDISGKNSLSGYLGFKWSWKDS